MFFLAYFVYWLALTGTLLFFLPLLRHQRVFAPLIIVGYLGVLFALGHLESWQRLFLGTVGLLHTIKWSATILSAEKMTLSGLFLYMTVWPGMRPILRNQKPASDQPAAQTKAIEHRFARGYVLFWIGVLFSVVIALQFDRLSSQAVGWCGLVAFVLMLHAGYADILTAVMQLTGWKVTPLFDCPWNAATMRDFWSHRWNVAFVEMNQMVFMPALRKYLTTGAAVFGVFLLSGVLHEIAISYSTGSAWGGPFAYFVLQGIWFLGEHRLRHHIGKHRMRIATICCILLPLPLLFTSAFQLTFIVPFFAWLHNILTAHDLQWYVATALWCAALGNFCTMLAGLQVPGKLNWHEELQRIRSFNRKILINYYFYIGAMIGSWGFLTVVLHGEMMNGERAAVWLAGLIAMFWTGRVVVDFCYFKPVDWPEGSDIVVGRALLSTLFILLALAYWAVVAWSVFAR